MKYNQEDSEYYEMIGKSIIEAVNQLMTGKVSGEKLIIPIYLKSHFQAFVRVEVELPKIVDCYTDLESGDLVTEVFNWDTSTQEFVKKLDNTDDQA